MRIHSRYNQLRESACYYARELGIDATKYVRIDILRLPHKHQKAGFCEFSETSRREFTIYVKLDQDREITLAHEMIHVRQVLARQGIDEIEAENLGIKLAKKRLTVTPLF